jgi:hypothetical protein
LQFVNSSHGSAKKANFPLKEIDLGVFFDHKTIIDDNEVYDELTYEKTEKS